MQSPQSLQQPPVSVLLVEDDPPVRRSLQLSLLSHGLDVRAYPSARQALDDPRARSAQCLIADFVIPDMDGIELLQALRAEGWDGPSILISGHLTDEVERKAREAGFDLVLNKPVTDFRLAAKVQALVGSSPDS